MTLLAALLTLARFSPVAVAGTTGEGCENPHCYSIARFEGILTGAWGEWPDENMSPGPSSSPNSNHIDSEFWLHLTNGAYIETGIYNGFEGGENYTGGCGEDCGGYAQFWSDTTAHNVQWIHYIYNISPNGASHTYEIQHAGTTDQWDVYIDSNLVGISTDTEGWTGNNQTVGGELEAPYVDYPEGSFASTFNMYVEGKNNHGTWYLYGKPYEDLTSAGFNAQTYGNSEFSWNEPL